MFNVTNATAVKQDLYPDYIFAHIVRIQPKTWIGNCAMRAEFFGWYEGKHYQCLLLFIDYIVTSFMTGLHRVKKLDRTLPIVLH